MAKKSVMLAIMGGGAPPKYGAKPPAPESMPEHEAQEPPEQERDEHRLCDKCAALLGALMPKPQEAAPEEPEQEIPA